MLFNLTTHQLFKSQNHSKAIICSKKSGPEFGAGELVAYEPFDEYINCRSSVNMSGYRIGVDSEIKSKLTNLECGKHKNVLFSFFTISELEVWQVIYEK